MLRCHRDFGGDRHHWWRHDGLFPALARLAPTSDSIRAWIRRIDLDLEHVFKRTRIHIVNAEPLCSHWPKRTRLWGWMLSETILRPLTWKQPKRGCLLIADQMAARPTCYGSRERFWCVPAQTSAFQTRVNFILGFRFILLLSLKKLDILHRSVFPLLHSRPPGLFPDDR